MIARIDHFSKTLPEVFKSGKMDFFQGSTPLNFIPFRLDNSPKDDEQTPGPSSVETTSGSTSQLLATAIGTEPQESPLSVDSETDVNAFAEAMVQVMEKTQSPIQEESSLLDPKASGQSDNLEMDDNPEEPRGRNRTSTPVLADQVTGKDASSTSLEANLQVAPISRTQLTELLPVQFDKGQESRESQQQPEDDTSSSLQDARHYLMEPVP